MADHDNELKLTSSQMIRRAARRLQTMTLEEKLAVMRASETADERIKARFVAHWQRSQAPETKS